MHSGTSETNAICGTISAVSQSYPAQQLSTLIRSPFHFRESPPSPDVMRTTKLIGAAPGSSAVPHLESTYDSEPRGFWEEESGNGCGGTDDGSRGEGDRSPGFGNSFQVLADAVLKHSPRSAFITTRIAMSPVNEGAPPSQSTAGERPINHNSEQPRSGPTISTTWPARAVQNQPPPVEDHPDDSTCHYPPLPSSYISAPCESKRNTLTSGESVKNDESGKATSERECVEELWLGLGWDERHNLVEAERKAILEKMRSKHNCGCGTCHKRWFVPSLAISGLEYAPNPETRSHIVDVLSCVLYLLFTPRFSWPQPLLIPSPSNACLIPSINVGKQLGGNRSINLSPTIGTQRTA